MEVYKRIWKELLIAFVLMQFLTAGMFVILTGLVFRNGVVPNPVVTFVMFGLLLFGLLLFGHLYSYGLNC